MHYTNMKTVESCYISSCNLLSQRHFNGNLSLFFFFQIHSHLLYKTTSAPVWFSLSRPLLRALTFFLITSFPLGLHQTSCPYQRQHKDKKLLHAWDLKRWLLPWKFPPPFLPLSHHQGYHVQCLPAPWSFPLGTIQVTCCVTSPLAQTTWPAFSVMCIRIPYCLYVQQFISDGWLPKAFSSHMLRLLKAAKKKRKSAD